MMRRIFWILITAAFPWLILLINDNPGGAFVAMVMQATIVGWIPASLWAWRIHHEAEIRSGKSKKKP